MRFDSDEYRREFWREVNTTGHTIGDLPYGFREYARSRTRSYGGNGVTLAVELGLLVGGAFAVWAAMRVVDRYLHGLRRPMYYEGERERRRALSAERRRIRRRRRSPTSGRRRASSRATYFGLPLHVHDEVTKRTLRWSTARRETIRL